MRGAAREEETGRRPYAIRVGARDVSTGVPCAAPGASPGRREAGGARRGRVPNERRRRPDAGLRARSGRFSGDARGLDFRATLATIDVPSSRFFFQSQPAHSTRVSGTGPMREARQFPDRPCCRKRLS